MYLWPQPQTPAQFYYGQQNYASFNNPSGHNLSRQNPTNASTRGPHALSNIYSDDTTAAASANLPSVIYERDSVNNYSNRKIYTTSSFGRQPETPQAQPKNNGIPPTLNTQKQQQQLQQQQQQQQSLVNSADSNSFYGRRNAESDSLMANNYASSRAMNMTRQLNMNTYYERNQVYQMQQPTYHTHMESNGMVNIQNFQPPPPLSTQAAEIGNLVIGY